jgi:hypothetical protein
LEGSFEASGPIKPSEVEDAPPLTTLSGDTFAYAVPAEEFECTSGGSANVKYDGTARYHAATVFVDSVGRVDDEGLENRTEFTTESSESVQCVMPRIAASAAPPFTTYTLSPGIPGGTTSFGWSGANCGSVTGSTTNTMVWDHGSEDCEHAGEAHPDATITLLVTGTFPVSGESFELNCTYTSAASGEGPDCTLAQ